MPRGPCPCSPLKSSMQDPPSAGLRAPPPRTEARTPGGQSTCLREAQGREDQIHLCRLTRRTTPGGALVCTVDSGEAPPTVTCTSVGMLTVGQAVAVRYTVRYPGFWDRSQRGSCALKLSASSDNLLVQETEEQGVLLCKRGSLLLPFPLITEGREQERVEENEKDRSRRQKMSDTDPPLGSRNCPRASCVPAAGRREAQRRSGRGRPWSCPVLTTSFLPPLPSGSPGKNGPESAPRLGEVPLCVLGRLEADAVTMTKRDSCGQCCDGSRLRAAGPLDPGAAPRALPRWTARVWTFFLIRILNTTHFTNNKKILTAFMIIRHLVKFQ